MATACLGLMSHFSHQMGPQRSRGCDRWPLCDGEGWTEPLVSSRFEKSRGHHRHRPPILTDLRGQPPPGPVGHRASGAAIRASLVVHDPAHTLLGQDGDACARPPPPDPRTPAKPVRRTTGRLLDPAPGPAARTILLPARRTFHMHHQRRHQPRARRNLPAHQQLTRSGRVGLHRGPLPVQGSWSKPTPAKPQPHTPGQQTPHRPDDSPLMGCGRPLGAQAPWTGSTEAHRPVTTWGPDRLIHWVASGGGRTAAAAGVGLGRGRLGKQQPRQSPPAARRRHRHHELIPNTPTTRPR